MTDPLSVVASIAGLVAVSAKIISLLKVLYDCGAREKGAPESISRVKAEMQDLNVIFARCNSSSWVRAGCRKAAD